MLNKLFHRVFPMSRKSPLPISEREKRFPDYDMRSIARTNLRKTGISHNEIDPLYILSLIKQYKEGLIPNSQKYTYFQNWYPAIENELKELSKYYLDDIVKLYIVQNNKILFEFYLIYDIHITDEKYVCINLDQYVAPYSYSASLINTFALLSSAGTLGVFISRLFL
jgi:hypothetical protein